MNENNPIITSIVIKVWHDDPRNSLYNFIDDENPKKYIRTSVYEYLLEEDWKHSAEWTRKCQQMPTDLGKGFEAQ